MYKLVYPDLKIRVLLGYKCNKFTCHTKIHQYLDYSKVRINTKIKERLLST